MYSPCVTLYSCQSESTTESSASRRHSDDAATAELFSPRTTSPTSSTRPQPRHSSSDLLLWMFLSLPRPLGSLMGMELRLSRVCRPVFYSSFAGIVPLTGVILWGKPQAAIFLKFADIYFWRNPRWINGFGELFIMSIR